MYDMQLISAWKAVKKKGNYVNFHHHNYHELVYYSFGSGETTVDERSYTFTDNCFVIIPPHISHDEYLYADTEVTCFEFSGSPELPHGLNKDRFGMVCKVLKELLSEAENQKYGYKDMISAKLNELCLLVLRNERNAVDEKSFEYIINYIKENYHEKIVLSDCAERLNLSYDYFQHKFKRLTGYSPRQFLILQRLSASEQMLKSGNLSCTEIAYRCGFSTSAQFSALFKRGYSQTPLQFRKKYKSL